MPGQFELMDGSRVVPEQFEPMKRRQGSAGTVYGLVERKHGGVGTVWVDRMETR